MLRGRKLSAERIEVRGVDETAVWDAARATEGFSGGWWARWGVLGSTRF